MSKETFPLWDTIPGQHSETPKITAYIPENKTSDTAVVIFPGGGYSMRAPHEGEGYAEFLNNNGITAFVVDYRVNPDLFPCPLLDARRAIKYVRYHADKYGINKNKIAAMGSSAGGHLTALLSTYTGDIDCDIEFDDIEKEDFLPDRQILCYPVIRLLGRDIAHLGSGEMLLGRDHCSMGELLQPDSLVSDSTPSAFIWHTSEDPAVSVANSYSYGQALRKHNIPTEMHIFPNGGHGGGLWRMDNIIARHNTQWSQLLINWLEYTYNV